MYSLTTVEGKTIKLNVAKIEVSSNSKIEGGYFIDLKLVGTLPGCRKSESLTFSFSTIHDEVRLTTLYGYRKHHSVKRSEINKLCSSIPVVGYIVNPSEITSELESIARQDRIKMYGELY